MRALSCLKAALQRHGPAAYAGPTRSMRSLLRRGGALAPDVNVVALLNVHVDSHLDIKRQDGGAGFERRGGRVQPPRAFVSYDVTSCLGEAYSTASSCGHIRQPDDHPADLRSRAPERGAMGLGRARPHDDVDRVRLVFQPQKMTPLAVLGCYRCVTIPPARTCSWSRPCGADLPPCECPIRSA